jgi:diaminopimelate epimerase
MTVSFSKYHALGNDFLVVARRNCPGRRAWSLARDMCDRHTGVGADGVLCLSPSRAADHRLDIYNADGGWAEKSGNGLRIAGVWASLKHRNRKQFTFECGGSVDKVFLQSGRSRDRIVSAELGRPDFATRSLPMKTRAPFCVNAVLRVGRYRLAATCLSTGNPHVVIEMDDFRSGWMALGAMIEKSPLFPRGTNVEFVQVKSRRKLRVMEWERGVGPTGSSGTGAAAAVAAMVVLGKAYRRCAVEFPAGVLDVHWRSDDGVIELIGPVTFVMQGTFSSRR